jgi:hypothetical protein
MRRTAMMIEDQEAYEKNKAEVKAKVQSVLENFKALDANMTKLLTMCAKHLKYKSRFDFEHPDLYWQAKEEQRQLLLALEDFLAKKENRETTDEDSK